MTRVSLRRVQEVFAAVVDATAGERERLLKEQCAGDKALEVEVRRVLQMASEDEGPLDTPAGMTGSDAAFGAATAADALMPAGGVIGRYRIVSVLGAGGMGVVYHAEQDRPRRSVALKVIRPGLTSPSVLRRFEFEAEMLGRLQHPGIAQIIEAGTFDSVRGVQPYFAMELVKGLTLGEYCRQNTLDVPQRLALMLKVCDAVEHAHQNGVIHRDLKPGNILVDANGDPKILDFGVARAAGAGIDGVADPRLTIVRTGEHQIIGTLGYMSPEQVEGRPDQIDTRTDVYALGVMLYEIVSGQLPHDLREKSLPEAARLVRDTDPASLSSIVRVARGDLDTITSKALEKDKSRRYQSAAALGDDLRRFLNDEPISARPPSAVYQMRKFARRNRALVAGAGLAVAALVVGLVAASAGFVSAARERDIARVALAQHKEASKVLKEMLAGIDPDVARGRDNFVVRRMLDDWAARVGNDLKGQPQVEFELRMVIGETYRKLARFDQSRTMFEAALALAKSAWGERSAQAGDATQGLGGALVWAGEFDKAAELFKAALELRRERFGPRSAEVAESLGELGNAVRKLGKLTDAESMLSESLAIRRETAGEPSRPVASALNDLAMTYLELGRLPEADKMQTQALAMGRQSYGEDHPETLRMLQNVGLVQYRMERFEDAEATDRKVIETAARIVPEDSALMNDSLDALGAVLNATGRWKEFDENAERSLAMKQRLYGPASLEVASAHYNRATSLMTRGDPKGAVEHARTAIGIARGVSEASHQLRDSLYILAQSLRQLKDMQGAEPVLRELLALDRKALPPMHPDLAFTTGSLASTLLELVWTTSDADPPVPLETQRQRADDAVTLLEEGTRIAQSSLPPGHWRGLITASNLCHAKAVRAMLTDATDPTARAQAITALAEARSQSIESYEKLLPPDVVPGIARNRVVPDAARLISKIERAWARTDAAHAAEHEAASKQWAEMADRLAKGEDPGPTPPAAGVSAR
jgi:tetratricopeptide (TPR) repeat protein